jgi:hypothetical protein
MTFTRPLRSFTLTAHVASSVAWLGAVAAFLALSIAGLISGDTHVVEAAYVSMELIGWMVIVPLSLTSLVTGLVQGLGTTWGLFRHWWVLIKLILNILAAILLLVHMQPIGHMARVVAETTLSNQDFREVRVQLVADAFAALLLLLTATALSVYKPRGLTRYGWRKLRAEQTRSPR